MNMDIETRDLNTLLAAVEAAINTHYYNVAFIGLHTDTSATSLSEVTRTTSEARSHHGYGRDEASKVGWWCSHYHNRHEQAYEAAA